MNWETLKTFQLVEILIGMSFLFPALQITKGECLWAEGLLSYGLVLLLDHLTACSDKLFPGHGGIKRNRRNKYGESGKHRI